MEHSHEHNLQRQSERPITDELIAAGAKFTRPKVCTCPWHEDKHASAGIFVGKDGVWRFKCQVCPEKAADVFDIRARMRGVALSEVLRAFNEKNIDRLPVKSSPSRANAFANRREEEKRVKTPTEELERPERPAKVFSSIDAIAAAVSGLECRPFVYTNPVTREPEMIVLRARDSDGKKTFLQAKPATGGFAFGAPAKPLPIYNRIRVAAADRVVVVEGEKCVHALAELDIVATTSPGGAGKASHADWSPLDGKDAVLWPDNDPVNEKGISTGIEHMREVAEILTARPGERRIAMVDPRDWDLPPKGDVVDFIASWPGESKEQLRKLVLTVLDTAASIGPASELKELIEDTISGKRSAIPFPWPNLSRLTNALMPGTVTVFAGEPGAGKSFALSECLVFWYQRNFNPAMYMLEDPRAYHLSRILAQLDENGELTDGEWIKSNAEQANAAFARHEATIDAIGRLITVSPDAEIELTHLIAWTEQKAIAGHRIIIIDPVTAASSKEDVWVADRKFIIGVKAIARRYGISVVLSTHPRMTAGKKGLPLENLAGGAAYPRFSHTVVWLSRLDKSESYRIYGPHGTFSSSCNRTMKIAKCRNGRGPGVDIGYYFDGASLRFGEQGVILGDDETTPEAMQTYVARDNQVSPVSPVKAKPPKPEKMMTDAQAGELTSKLPSMFKGGGLTAEMGKAFRIALRDYTYSLARSVISRESLAHKPGTQVDIVALLDKIDAANGRGKVFDTEELP